MSQSYNKRWGSQLRRNLALGMLIGCSCGESASNPFNPCNGQLFLDNGASIAASVKPNQAHALGDVDGDGVRDLLSLSTDGKLYVLRGPSFQEQLLNITLEGIAPDDALRYKMSVLNLHSGEPTELGSYLYILDTHTGGIAEYQLKDRVRKLRDVVLRLHQNRDLDSTTAFVATFMGPSPLGDHVFVLAYTHAIPLDNVRLAFFNLDGSPHQMEFRAQCGVDNANVSNECLTQVPGNSVELTEVADVDYLLTDWNSGEEIDVIAVIRQPNRTDISIWYGEDDWTQATEFSSPIRLKDGFQPMFVRAITVLVGADNPIGGRGGKPSCLPIVGCKCDVDLRTPTLFALNRCEARSPSATPQVYRLSTPETIQVQRGWLVDYFCPHNPTITD
jgi:hypothetical protein